MYFFRNSLMQTLIYSAWAHSEEFNAKENGGLSWKALQLCTAYENINFSLRRTNRKIQQKNDTTYRRPTLPYQKNLQSFWMNIVFLHWDGWNPFFILHTKIWTFIISRKIRAKFRDNFFAFQNLPLVYPPSYKGIQRQPCTYCEISHLIQQQKTKTISYNWKLL